MTHEQFITLETAKLAKQAGFDWECEYRYIAEPDYREPSFVPKSLGNGSSYIYPAPPQSVLQRWLREVKGMSVEVYHEIVWVESGALGIKWSYRICYINTNENDILSSDEFNTYEDAFEKGLQKCLTTLIEK